MRARRGSVESAILKLAVENGEVYGLGILRELRLPHEKYSSVKGALAKLVNRLWIYEDRVEKGFRSRRVFYKPTLLGVVKYLRRRSKKFKKRDEFKDWIEGIDEILRINIHLCPPLFKNLNTLKETQLLPIFFNPFLELKAEASYGRLIFWGNILRLAGDFLSINELLKKYQPHINYDILLGAVTIFCFLTKNGSQLIERFEKGMQELFSRDSEFREFHLSYMQWFTQLEEDLMKLRDLKKRIMQEDYSAVLPSIVEAQMLEDVTSIILRKKATS